MSTVWQIVLAVVSFAAVMGGSVLLSRSLGAIARAISIPEQFLGFLTALAADSPEITSAIVAMVSGHQDVGVGVVIGSNLFNLASLLGVAAMLSGKVAVRRGTVLLNGGVGLLVTGLAVLLVSGAGPRIVIAAAILLVPIPYAATLWMSGVQLRRLPLPASWTEFLAAATGESLSHGRDMAADEGSSESGGAIGSAGWRAAGSLALIVAGSVGLVRMTTGLTEGWLPHALLGPVVLAGLTGIPNLYTAVRLAMRHKGAAVLTEAMNSNLLNIVAGLALPAIAFGGMATGERSAAYWLLALTVAATALASWRGGLGRVGGAVLIAGYLIFVAVRISLVL